MPRLEPRLSMQTLLVLRTLAARPNRAIAGSDILKETKILSGSLYPILLRLEKAGWLSSEWEKVDPKEVGRPRKRLYSLTAIGARKTLQALSDLMPAVEGLTWVH